MNAVEICMKNGSMKIKYSGIIEIYPRKATNTYVFNAALHTLSETHDLIKMCDNWIRAFKKKS